MVDIDRAAKQAAIARVDKLTESPESRASKVWTLLKSEHPDLTDWDLICFASQYIASNVARWTWLELVAKSLSSLIYTAHYIAFDEMKDEITNVGAKHINQSSKLDNSSSTTIEGYQSNNFSE